MIKVALLGTSGTKALPTRPLTAFFCSHAGTSILIDAGEGVQTSFYGLGLDQLKEINIIAITHGHLDHWGGLIGLIDSMSNDGRREPLILVIPKSFEYKLELIKNITKPIFDIDAIVIHSKEEEIDFGSFKLKAFQVNHTVETYGYSITMESIGQFDLDKAINSGIPEDYWSVLQVGNIIKSAAFKLDKSIFTSNAKDFKITYCTDTRMCPMLESNAEGSNILVLEGMYPEEDSQKAHDKYHMTMIDAANLAVKVQPDELWLTHFTQSLVDLDKYKPVVSSIFPRVYMENRPQIREVIFTKKEEKGYTLNINYRQTKY